MGEGGSAAHDAIQGIRPVEVFVESGKQKMLRQTIQNRTINEMTVFSQFLQQICGTEPTKEDEALFQTLFTELKEEQANS